MKELDLLYEVLEETDEAIVEGYTKYSTDIRLPLIRTKNSGREIRIKFLKEEDTLSVYIKVKDTKFYISVLINDCSRVINIDDLTLKEVIPNLKSLKPKVEELIREREGKEERENKIKRELKEQLRRDSR